MPFSSLTPSPALACAACLWASTAIATEVPLTLNSVDYPPLSYADDNPERRGLVLDLAAQVWRQSGWPFSPRFYPFKRALELTKTDSHSCLVPASRTPEREQSFRWIGPIYRGAYVLMGVPNRVPVLGRLSEVQHYRVGVMRGSGLQAELERQGITAVVDATPSALFKLLNQGNIDFWATHDVVGYHEARINNRRLKVALRLQEVDTYIACNPAISQETAQRLQQKTEEILKNRAFHQLQQRYGLEGEGN